MNGILNRIEAEPDYYRRKELLKMVVEFSPNGEKIICSINNPAQDLSEKNRSLCALISSQGLEETIRMRNKKMEADKNCEKHKEPSDSSNAITTEQKKSILARIAEAIGKGKSTRVK